MSTLLEPHLALNTIVDMKLIRNIITAVTAQFSNTTSLFERQVLKVLAPLCAGSASGIHGRNKSKVA